MALFCLRTKAFPVRFGNLLLYAVAVVSTSNSSFAGSYQHHSFASGDDDSDDSSTFHQDSSRHSPSSESVLGAPIDVYNTSMAEPPLYVKEKPDVSRKSTKEIMHHKEPVQRHLASPKSPHQVAVETRALGLLQCIHMVEKYPWWMVKRMIRFHHPPTVDQHTACSTKILVHTIPVRRRCSRLKGPMTRPCDRQGPVVTIKTFRSLITHRRMILPVRLLKYQTTTR